MPQTIIEFRCFHCNELLATGSKGEKVSGYEEIKSELSTQVTINKGIVYLICPKDSKETEVGKSNEITHLWVPGRTRIY